MQQDNINGTIKLLTNNMQNRVLPLNEKSLEQRRQKHRKTSPATESLLLTDILKIFILSNLRTQGKNR